MDALEHGTEKMGDLIVTLYIYDEHCTLAGREWLGDDDEAPDCTTCYEGTPEELMQRQAIIRSAPRAGAFEFRVARSIREAVEYL